MPSSFAREVGMPAVQLLRQESNEVGQGGEQGNLEITRSGEALQDGRQPERNSVIARDCEEIAEGKQEYIPMAQRLPGTALESTFLRSFLLIELVGNPLAFFRV